MARTTTVEVWVAVDEDGGYVVGSSREDAVESADAEKGYRLVKATLTVPVPEVIELTADVSSDEPQATVA